MSFKEEVFGFKNLLIHNQFYKQNLFAFLGMRKSWVWVFCLALLVLGLRLFIALQAPTLSSDEAYFNYRQAEHVRSTGLPLVSDPLSYGGRTIVLSPVFHYLVAGVALLVPLELAAKIVPNVLATFLVIIIYGIALYLTRNFWIAVFAAFLSAFVPVWFGHTINTLSPVTLALPLFFLLLYALLRIHKPFWRATYLCGLVVLAFTHPLVLLFAIGLLCYLVLLVVEQLKQKRVELEVVLFSIFFVLWSQFLLYKKPILAHGVGVVWQNTPPLLLTQYFAGMTILGAVYQIGILPALYGVFIVYKYLFREKHQQIYLFVAFVAATGLLLWFRLIPLILGLQLIGLLLVVLFAYWLRFFLAAIKKTRFQRLKPFFAFGFFIAFVGSSIIPSFLIAHDLQDQAVSDEELAVFDWLREKTNEQSVIAAPLEYGNLITALAKRKNVIDANFLLQKDAKQRLENIHRLYKTPFEFEAIEIMDAYGADYVLVPPEYAGALNFASESGCFGTAYEAGGFVVYIKHSFCKVEVVA